MFKKRHKVYLKLNLVSIVFAVVSFISVSFAWFAYSGLVDVKTEVGVKAWYIEFEKNNEVVSNDIVISVSDLYPGMEPLTEVITIKNLGDSDAKLNYSIDYARILDDNKDYYVLSDDYTSDRIEDALAHNYPFSINATLSKTRLNAKDTDAEFIVTDSFHACVFSIIFHKPFVVIGNIERGSDRFISLLSSLSLENNLIYSITEYDKNNDYKINEITYKKLDHCKRFSMGFIYESLNVKNEKSIN